MKVRDIFDPKVATVGPDESASYAWQQIQALRADHLVVVQGGRVLGVLSRHDLSGPSGGAHRRMGRRVGELMHRDVVKATPATSVRRAAARMRRHGIGCLPVVERRKLVGIVTVARLLALLEHELDDS